MQVHRIVSARTPIDFDAALKRATEVANEQLGENVLLSWYDRDRELESPAHAGECHENCPTRGYPDYALNRGATLGGGFRRRPLCVLFPASAVV